MQQDGYNQGCRAGTGAQGILDGWSQTILNGGARA